MPNPPKTKTPAQLAAERAKYQTTTTYGKDAFPKNQKDFSQFGYEPVSGSYKSGDALYKRKGDSGKEEFFYFGDLPKTKGTTDYWGMFPTPNPNAVTAAPIIPPVKNNTPNPADVLRKPIEFGTAGTYNPNTGLNLDYENKVVEPIVEQYKNGGKVKKKMGYANGGEIDPNEYNQYDSTNPALSSAASTGLNMVIPGAGTAVGIGLQGKDALTTGLTQIDPKTGKYKNKTNAYGGGLIDAAFKATPLGMAQTALDPTKDLGEKALSIGTFGLADIVKSKRGTDNMEQSNIGLNEAAKLQEEQDRKNALAQGSLSKQLADRALGYKNGGKIEGAGTAKSDSITAKIKPNSFVIPAEMAATAETIRKVVLKAPKTKANLNQAGGTKVKLSNGEVLFTPKEVEKVENALGDNALDKLAPKSAKKDVNSSGNVFSLNIVAANFSSLGTYPFANGIGLPSFM